MRVFPTSHRFRVRRGAVIAFLLLLVFGVAAALGVQAYYTARYHRAQADRVLRDYAALAAARIAQRSAQYIYWAVIPPLKALQHAHEVAPNKPLPAPKDLHFDSMEREFSLRPYIRYTFRMDLQTRQLTTSGPTVPPQVRSWMSDTLPVHARTVYDTSWTMGSVLGQPGGERRYVVYTLLRDADGVFRTAVGFEAKPAALRPLVEEGTEKFPLLPRPLTGGVQYDSMGSVIITDRFGVEIYRSAVQYSSPYTARDTIGTDMGDLFAHTTLRAAVADQLIIGGLPRSRLPLILTLLGLTAVLIGIALFQLRRESQLARLRSDFISGVSHELRTPLAQIRMFSETLTLGRVRSDDERRRSLAIIDQEARRLTHLVENLLHFSRSERQTTHITPEPMPLAPLVQEVIDGFAPLAAARGATLAAAVPDDLIVTADPGAVRQMLLNLLDNAVKYGPAGQEVRIGASRENGAARLWVDDGGPGIPRSDRERVWVRFWRLERDRDSAVAGSGIGLAVVRELATLHHGRAFIDDAAPTAGAGTRVVIEDNPDLAYGLRNNLEIEGYEVEVAKDGAKGLTRAKTAKPDLVVLDLMLPGMDGFRVLRALREDGHGMPVLILTARGEEADKVRGLRLGADDYVTKPFGVLELLARIEALLRRVVAPKKNGGPPTPMLEKFGDIEVLTPSRTVLRDGAPVSLTPKEYDLLVALIRRDGACITRSELLTEVWGYSAEVMSRTVDTHVAELRRKLEHDPANPKHILTVRKTGYRLAR